MPREAIELAIKCFSRALELTGMQDMVKRLGNVENMLGVFYTQLMAEDDALWPQPDRMRQELENVIGDEHISFTNRKIGSLVNVNQSCDTDLVQDLKCVVFSLISLHFK